MKGFKKDIFPVPDCKVEFLEVLTIEVEQSRYDELIAKEERLRLLENAIRNSNYSVNEIKKCFDLEDKE